jgi:hypothetical protein
MPMHKIRLLDEETINKIAASEVIERPASRADWRGDKEAIVHNTPMSCHTSEIFRSDHCAS